MDTVAILGLHAESEMLEIARELINILSVTHVVLSEVLLAAMRDRASVNIVAMIYLS